jgi:hypothetical protein
VGILQVLFQSGRLKISKKLALASILQAELLIFKVKIDPRTAHDSFSAWREQDHDDLVLSVSLAAWQGEREVDIPPLVCVEATKKPSWSSGDRDTNWIARASNGMIQAQRDRKV